MLRNQHDNIALLIRAAEDGRLDKVRRLVEIEGVDPGVFDSQPLRVAAKNGRLEMVDYLLGVDSVNPAARGNEAIVRAAQNGHLEIVERLLAYNGAQNDNAIIRTIQGFFATAKHLLGRGHDVVNPADNNNAAIIGAAENGHAAIVERLLRCDGVNPGARNNAALIGAAIKGHAAIVERLLRCDDVNPAAQNNLAIIGAARNAHAAVVARLLCCDGVNLDVEETIRRAIRNGQLEMVRVLLANGGVTVQPWYINIASSNGHTEVAALLEEHLLKNPKEQMAQLIAAHESVLSYEGEHGLSGEESSMDVYLERQAAQQRSLLSKRYAKESLASGQNLLRELVFRALQSHIETNAPEAEEKLRFLSEHMDDLIAGKTKFLSKAAALFNSNEDIYEIASRAVNTQAPVMKGPLGDDIWPNLITVAGDAGKWVQSYAGNIAREIAASEGQPHYDTCLYALIYRLAEIRRAHNEGDVIRTDNPSCFSGTKTRLLKVLGTHPDHRHYIRVEWKAACYEGAVRHVEQMFGQMLDKMDSPEEAEQLLDALLIMQLDNKEAIQSGEALSGVSGDRQVYAKEHCEKRYAFILKIREGLQESVNAYLCKQGLEPILEGDSKAIYLKFLEKALGEGWMASRLSSVYLQHAPKAELEEALKETPTILFSMDMQKLREQHLLKERFYDYCKNEHPKVALLAEQVNDFFAGVKTPAQLDETALFEDAFKRLARQSRQSLQGLKRRFYEHCEELYPEVELSVEQVNDFFAGVKTPAGADERALFEDAFEQLASGESHEGRPPSLAP